MSLLYVAGTYYNDACDAEYDQQHQPHRPIASGLISVHRVEAFAFVYVMLALILIYTARLSSPPALGSSSIAWLSSSLALIACIAIYNHHHKNNPLSPLLMAGCRVGVLLTTSYVLAANLPLVMFLFVSATLAWLVGLTYLAKHERSPEEADKKLINHWPVALLSVPILIGALISLSSPLVLIPVALIGRTIWKAREQLRNDPSSQKGQAIGMMIAGICLVDGIFLTWIWGIHGAIVSALAFGLTLALQRWIAGT